MKQVLINLEFMFDVEKTFGQKNVGLYCKILNNNSDLSSTPVKTRPMSAT